MKNIFLITTLLISIFLNTVPAMATSSSASTSVAIEKNTVSEASVKNLRKQNKSEKRLERFQEKMEKRFAKLKKKGKVNSEMNLDFIGLIVLALGGLFILLGLIIPIVGILFIVIGAIIAFVGLVILLLLKGAKISSGDSSH